MQYKNEKSIIFFVGAFFVGPFLLMRSRKIKLDFFTNMLGTLRTLGQVSQRSMSTLTSPLAGASPDVLVQGTPEEFKSTTLPNGFRVVSSETFSPSCTIGLVVQAGSRYEGSDLP